jgi:hypothetical protein
MDKTIYIKSQTRPIRFAYLVRNVAEFVAAVKFYTHSWGGSSNIILPLPQTKYQAGLFEHALYKFDPDLIIHVDDDMPEIASKVLRDMTAPLAKVGDPEFIDQFVENQGRAFYQERRFPHMMDILELHKITGKDLVCISNEAGLEQGLTVQAGMPGVAYLEEIKKENRVVYVKSVESYTDQLRASILVSASKTVRSLTLEGVRPSWDLDYGSMLRSNNFLYIYLYKPSDVEIWSTYWNQSGYVSENKLLLPRDGFLDNLDAVVNCVMGMSTKFKYVRLVLNTTRSSAIHLQKIVADAFNETGERKIDIDVIYDGDIYHIEPTQLAWKKPFRTSQIIDDSLLRFDPVIPNGFDGTPLAFAFDASLTTKDGIGVGLPDTIISSRILTFGTKRLEQFDYKYDSVESWFPYPRVRSTHRGISAVAASRLKDESIVDASFFLPPDEDVVQSYVYQSGFSLVPNEAAHYAKVFLRKIKFTGNRSESFDELEVASCLIGARYENVTCTMKQIVDRFANVRGCEKPEAQGVINKTLPKLLHVGVVRRGYSIKCEHCMYTDWYPIEEVGEVVKCIGCGEDTVTPLQTVFKFRLSELTRQFFQRGGRAVVNTLWLFSQRGIPGIGSIGGEIVPIGKRKSIADVDVILLTVDEVGVVECKDWKVIREQGKNKLQASIQGLIGAAVRLGASSAYLSIATSEPSEKIIKYIKPFYKNARSQGVALRLIVNERLYEFRVRKGKMIVNDFDLKTSKIYRYTNRRDSIIGEKYRNHGGSGHGIYYGATDIETIKRDLLRDSNV